MKKKICSLVLALLCMATMVGCSSEGGDEKEAVAIMKTINKNMKKEDSATGTMTMEMKMESLGQGEFLSIKMDFVMNNLKEQDVNTMEAMIDMKMSFLDTEQDIMMYMYEGAIYAEMEGQKIKMQQEDMSQADYIKQTEIKLFDEKEIKSAKVKEEDGYTIVTLTLTNEAVKELMNNQLEDVMKTAGASNFEFKEVSVVYKIDKHDNPVEQVIRVGMKVDIMGQEVVYRMITTISYDSFEPVNIEFPDFSQYEEYGY